MCGLVGIYVFRQKRPIDPGLLERMNETQHHRGPDAGGVFVDPGVGLGHRRLSIIDLAAGAQPLFNDDESVVVVYNGEIYNYRSLADELKAKGHRFATRCDTEVVVNAWREWGEACVEHFRGMFAFALYDRREDVLFLARDRVGIKPLYYAEVGDSLVFASELKGVMAYPGVSRRLDPMAVEEYFAFGYVPQPRSIFAGVRKLPPGHTLTVRRDRMATPREYWDLKPAALHTQAAPDLAVELIERLREAVGSRMISDVPLGAFLSGGVDSSAVVAMMAGLSDQPVNTCSISFDEKKYDESRHADAVAHRYNTRHQAKTVRVDDFDLIDRLAGMFDEPFADSSAMPTFRVCELARQTVTVALSGDGGDEVFAGYQRYRWQETEARLRRIMGRHGVRTLVHLLAPLRRIMSGGLLDSAAETLAAAGQNPEESYFATIGVMPKALRRTIFSRGMTQDLQDYAAESILSEQLAAAPTDTWLSRLQYADFKTYLPDDILTKVDRTSMAVSLEVRVPVLDHHFVEWASGIPSALLLQGREGKYLFKKALAPYLPHDVLYRRKKGFAVPLAEWFRGPLRSRVQQALLNGHLHDTGLFDMAAVTRLADQHQDGTADHSAALWSLLMFESFIRHWEESNIVDHATGSMGVSAPL